MSRPSHHHHHSIGGSEDDGRSSRGWYWGFVWLAGGRYTAAIRLSMYCVRSRVGDAASRMGSVTGNIGLVSAMPGVQVLKSE